MLYEIAHFLRDKMPFLWDLIDIINSFLFGIRYGRKLEIAEKELDSVGGEYRIVPIRDCKTEELVDFFEKQPEEAFEYFRPHGFDEKSLQKLQSYKAFIAYVVIATETISDDFNTSKVSSNNSTKIVGYFFGRSFFWGKTFIGRMVDVDYRGKGIAKMMNRVTMQIATTLGLRVFQTISPENIASLKCAKAENELHIIKTMPNGDIFVENWPKKDQ